MDISRRPPDQPGPIEPTMPSTVTDQSESLPTSGGAEIVDITAPPDRGRDVTVARADTDVPPAPETPSAVAEGRQPLFDLIDNQGSPDIPRDQKVEPVFDAAPILERMGVNSNLIHEVSTTAESLRPLGALVLNRPPERSEEDKLEGRGAYHEHIPVGDKEATVYVKGSGSARSFEQSQEGGFTGYPSDPDKMFYDTLVGHAHPRVLGTETVRWGIMEAVNASFIFGHVARERGWTTIAEAIDAGVTIPLNVLHQRELSAHVGSLIDHYAAGNDGFIFEANALAWQGNRHLGTVSMIVPSSVRVAGGIGEDDRAAADLVGRLSNSDVARGTAQTLRTLLDVGFCYSEASSHGQNMYANGLVAQADSSDLVSLGDYKGHVPTEDSYGQAASAEQQRVALLFKQFDRSDMLTPPHAPLYREGNVALSWDQVTETGRAFWGKMLEGVADPAAVDRMVELLPVLKTEFAAAAAKLLVKQHDQAYWEQVAADKRAMLSQYEPTYGVLTEYDAKVGDNLHEYDSTPSNLTNVSNEGKLQDKAVMDFLNSGDESYLHAHPILDKAVRLIDEVSRIPDSNTRDRLMSGIAYNFASKDVGHLHRKPDPASAFHGDQYDLVGWLVSEGCYQDAKDALDTMTITKDQGFDGIGGYYTSERDGEVNHHKYTRLLLDASEPIADILAQAKMEAGVGALAQRANTGGYGLGEMMRFKMLDPPQHPPFMVGAVADALGYPSPNSVITYTMATYAHSPADRTAITEWVMAYNAKVLELETTSPTPERRAELFTDMDMAAAGIVDTYPELAFGHYSYAAGRHAAIDPVRAQEYQDRCTEYYQTRLADRSARVPGGLGPSIERTSPSRERRREVAARYLRMGYPHVARYYENASTLDPWW